MVDDDEELVEIQMDAKENMLLHENPGQRMTVITNFASHDDFIPDKMKGRFTWQRFFKARHLKNR